MPPKVILRTHSKEAEGGFTDQVVLELPSEEGGIYSNPPTGIYGVRVGFDMQTKPQRVALNDLPDFLSGTRRKNSRTVQLGHLGVGRSDLGGGEEIIVDLGRPLNINSSNTSDRRRREVQEPPKYSIREVQIPSQTIVGIEDIVSIEERDLRTTIAERLEEFSERTRIDTYGIFPYFSEERLDFNGQPIPQGQVRISTTAPIDPDERRPYDLLISQGLAILRDEKIDAADRVGALDSLIAQIFAKS